MFSEDSIRKIIALGTNDEGVFTGDGPFFKWATSTNEEWAQFVAAGGLSETASVERRAPTGDAEASGQPTHYLELPTQSCEEEDEEEEFRYEVRPCRCGSRFCIDCCVGMGLRLRARLIPILKTFKRILMWTFTIDPSLFRNPEHAFDYVKEQRSISNCMRALRSDDCLSSDRYFYVIEWQKFTAMPHFHLLADAKFIPFDRVCELWNRNRPNWVGPVEGKRPGFGAIRFSQDDFCNAEHAAHYACKYLIKHPDHGYPAWVLKRSNISRYGTNRGFWGDSSKSKKMTVEKEASESPEHLPPRRSIGERLKACGQSSSLLKVFDVEIGGGEIVERRRFVERIKISFSELLEKFGQPEMQRFIVVTKQEAERLSAGQLPETGNRFYGKQVEGNDQRKSALHAGSTD